MISELYFHLVYRDDWIKKKWFGVNNDDTLISSMFAMAIFQSVNLGTIFNIYTSIFGVVKIDNVVAVVISIFVVLINAAIIAKKGFEKIKNLYLNSSRKKNRIKDMVGVLYIILTFFAFFLTL